MIVALTTDLAIDSRLLSRSLDESIRTSFGRLILDGELDWPEAGGRSGAHRQQDPDGGTP